MTLRAIDTRCIGVGCEKAPRCARTRDMATAAPPWTPVVDKLCIVDPRIVKGDKRPRFAGFISQRAR